MAYEHLAVQPWEVAVMLENGTPKKTIIKLTGFSREKFNQLARKAEKTQEVEVAIQRAFLARWVSVRRKHLSVLHRRNVRLYYWSPR